MNPEQNKQPNQVDQLPQPELTNQPIVTPPFEPTIIQPASTPQPLDTVTASQQPPITVATQPMQTPQPITQPVTTTSTTQKSKKPFVIAGIAVVIIIIIASGAFAYSNIGTETTADVDDGINAVIEPKTNTAVSETNLSSNTNEQSPESNNASVSENSTLLINTRDAERKSNLSKIAAIISEYQANNNGKIPPDAQTVEKVIASNQLNSITDPLSKKEYVIIAYVPTRDITNEVQYAPQQTCTGPELTPSSSRSFALRSYLESGELVCLSS